MKKSVLARGEMNIGAAWSSRTARRALYSKARKVGISKERVDEMIAQGLISPFNTVVNTGYSRILRNK